MGNPEKLHYARQLCCPQSTTIVLATESTVTLGSRRLKTFLTHLIVFVWGSEIIISDSRNTSRVQTGSLPRPVIFRFGRMCVNRIVH